MHYKFIENMYPYDDPNINLNFDNDILYRHLKPQRYKYTPSDNQCNTNNSNLVLDTQTKFVLFVSFVILVVFTWYILSRYISDTPKVIKITA